MKLRVLCIPVFIYLASLIAVAQQVTPPVPQRIVVHSKVLNEDRAMWVRTPPGYEKSKNVYPVVYQTDGDSASDVNEIASTIDYLVIHNRMPQVIVVGIENTDRTRDLTPSKAGSKRPDGTVVPYPTSGGGDKFLDFIQTELMPEVERRYRTAPYRVFSGHSFGGLLGIHALITRPDMFSAYLAVSPSLQWDDGRTFRQAQEFFAKTGELKKTLFFSLANEGKTPNPMGENFEGLQKILGNRVPKGFAWGSARFPDEDHGSTVLLAHYAGLKKIFEGWGVPREENGAFVGGLAGVERHYADLSERYGYKIPLPEASVNELGYQFLALKRPDEAVAAFQRGVELYPLSANVYDSLGEGLEAAGKFEAAAQNFQKAIELGTKNGESGLPAFKKHLERATAAAKSAVETPAPGK